MLQVFHCADPVICSSVVYLFRLEEIIVSVAHLPLVTDQISLRFLLPNMGKIFSVACGNALQEILSTNVVCWLTFHVSEEIDTINLLEVQNNLLKRRLQELSIICRVIGGYQWLYQVLLPNRWTSWLIVEHGNSVGWNPPINLCLPNLVSVITFSQFQKYMKSFSLQMYNIKVIAHGQIAQIAWKLYIILRCLISLTTVPIFMIPKAYESSLTTDVLHHGPIVRAHGHFARIAQIG